MAILVEEVLRHCRFQNTRLDCSSTRLPFRRAYNWLEGRVSDRAFSLYTMGKQHATDLSLAQTLLINGREHVAEDLLALAVGSPEAITEGESTAR